MGDPILLCGGRVVGAMAFFGSLANIVWAPATLWVGFGAGAVMAASHLLGWWK